VDDKSSGYAAKTSYLRVNAETPGSLLRWAAQGKTKIPFLLRWAFLQKRKEAKLRWQLLPNLLFNFFQFIQYHVGTEREKSAT